MIISRTPLRISFVGGGSDIESFYTYTPGAVVATTINKYIYIMVSKQFDGRIIAQYSQTEIVRKVSEIQNNLIREAMKLVGIDKGVHISSISDVPSEGTGMGSSSAYLVGLLNALYAYKGKHISAKQLAYEAYLIEKDILKKPIGKQDQYIAAYGGFQYIQFNSDNTVFIDPIICLPNKKRDIEKKLLLFYTGLTRSADTILEKQNQILKNNIEKRNVMNEMVIMAKNLRNNLNKNKLVHFGEFLDKSWNLKKSITDKISTKQIDRWYAKAKKAGAIGGKILGAGGGGFLLLYASQKDHENIKTALRDLTYLELKFEPQGSRIIFIDDE